MAEQQASSSEPTSSELENEHKFKLNQMLGIEDPEANQKNGNLFEVFKERLAKEQTKNNEGKRKAVAYWLLFLDLLYFCQQVPALVNPKTDMHFNMNLLYTIVSLIVATAYGQVILEKDEGNKTFMLHAMNLHWFRMTIKILDLEGLQGIISDQRYQNVMTSIFIIGQQFFLPLFVQHRNESDLYRWTGYIIIVVSDVIVVYKFQEYFDDTQAFIQIFLLFFLLPFATLTYTWGHNSQTVDQLVKRTEQMVEFNQILDNLREYVVILDYSKGVDQTAFRYVNQQFLRHFSHQIVPCSDSQVFRPLEKQLREDPELSALTIYDRICCCFGSRKPTYIDTEPDLAMTVDHNKLNQSSAILDKLIFEEFNPTDQKASRKQKKKPRSYSIKDLLKMSEKRLGQKIFKVSICVEGVFIHESNQNMTQAKLVRVLRKSFNRDSKDLVMLQILDMTASVQLERSRHKKLSQNSFGTNMVPVVQHLVTKLQALCLVFNEQIQKLQSHVLGNIDRKIKAVWDLQELPAPLLSFKHALKSQEHFMTRLSYVIQSARDYTAIKTDQFNKTSSIVSIDEILAQASELSEIKFGNPSNASDNQNDLNSNSSLVQEKQHVICTDGQRLLQVLLLLVEVAEAHNEFSRLQLYVKQESQLENYEITVHDCNFELSIVELERLRSILSHKKPERSDQELEGAYHKLHIADTIATTYDGVVTVQSSEEEGTKYTLLMRTDIEVSNSEESIAEIPPVEIYMREKPERNTREFIFEPSKPSRQLSLMKKQLEAKINASQPSGQVSVEGKRQMVHSAEVRRHAFVISQPKDQNIQGS